MKGGLTGRPFSIPIICRTRTSSAVICTHHSARSANKLTYGLYSAGVSDEQKREIVEGVRSNTADVSRSTRPMSPSEVWGGKVALFFN
jgi:hypothetical protein